MVNGTRTKFKKFSFICWNLTLFILLVILYKIYIVPLFGYAGFDANFIFFRLPISIILLILFTLLVEYSYNEKRISMAVIYLLFILSYFPMLTLYLYDEATNMALFYYSIFWFVMIVLNKIDVTVDVVKIKEYQSNVIRWILFVLTLVTTIYLLIYVYRFKFNFELFSLLSTEIYDTRALAKASSEGVFAYIASWVVKIILPLLFMYYYDKRQKVIVVILLLSSFLLFMASPVKSNLMIIPVALIVYYSYKSDSNLNVIFIKILVLSITLALCLYLLFDLRFPDILLNLIVRRTMFVPAYLGLQYYDFFSQNDPFYFSSSILKSFVNNPYGMGPVELISQTYAGKSLYPNNGLFGDAFAQLGYLGVFIYPVLYNVVFSVIDNICRKLNVRLILGIFISITNSLLNSALLTCLFTHGILVMIALIYLTIPNNQPTIQSCRNKQD